MHTLQEQILDIINSTDLSGKTLREIGDIINEKSAQKVKHHLLQLTKKGFISYNPATKEIKRVPTVTSEGFVSLKLMGSANCGPANIFADDNIQGYLKVSKKMVPSKGDLYVLRADGTSMNRANIKDGRTIDDGDFVIVDASQRDPRTGHYVVSLIDEMANIKKFVRDNKNNRIVLESESTGDFLPIYIHEDDQFQVAARVVDVIKR